MVKILTINVKSETSESFVVMWELLNECLQKLTKNKNYKFNPTGWMADENGANWIGIEKVFGKDSLYRVVSCKFHFLQARNTHQNKILNDADKERFTSLANKRKHMPVTYDFNMPVYYFINTCSVKKNDLKHFLLWWHERRSHVFEPF